MITNIRWNGEQDLLGYLIHTATTEPRSFVGLLGRVLPLNDNARVMRDEATVYRDTNELLAELPNRRRYVSSRVNKYRQAAKDEEREVGAA